jgi:hypothetical protein
MQLSQSIQFILATYNEFLQKRFVRCELDLPALVAALVISVQESKLCNGQWAYTSS